EQSDAIVACGSAVDIPAPVAPRRYGYVHNRVHNRPFSSLFAGFSRSVRLWIALVAARCGEFPSGTGRRLAAMAGHVSSRAPAMQLRVSPNARVPSAADRADTGRPARGNSAD